MFAGQLKVSEREGKRDVQYVLCPVGRVALSSKEAEIKALEEKVFTAGGYGKPRCDPTYSFILTCYHSW